MKTPEHGEGSGASAGSAVTVVVCDGHRCHALQDRVDTGSSGGPSTLLGVLGERIRRSRYGVLIRGGCLGVCARAPAVWLVRRSSPQADGGTGTLFGPVESAEQVHELLDAVPVEIERPSHQQPPG